MTPVNAIGSNPLDQRPDVKSTADAARQFEALLIGFMLKSVREGSSSSWLDSGQDSAASSATGYAEEHFAQALAASGGLGLAKTITASLEDQARAKTASGAATGIIDPEAKP